MITKDIEIPWGPIKVLVINTSIRNRVDIHEKVEEYCVIHVVNVNELEEIEEEIKRKRKRRKFLCLMCFLPRIYEKIELKRIYSFCGFLSFGFGSTYLCATKCRDALGIPIQSDESVFFCPPEAEDAS